MVRIKALVIMLVAALPMQAQEFFTLKGHGGPIMDIAVGPDGQIATASFDNAVGLWTETGPRWLDGHGAAVNAVVYPTGGQVISGSDDFSVRIWDPKTGMGQVAHQHAGKVMGLASSGDGSIVVSASWDGTIAVLRDGRVPLVLEGHRAGVNDVALDDAGKRVISTSTDGTIRVWDIATGRESRQIVRHGFGINEMVIDEAAGWLAYGAVDGVTRIVDLETGDLIKDVTLDRRPILAMAHDPVGNRLAVGDGEGFIMILSTTDWSIERDFRATLRGPVWALAFSPDGQNIHAGGLDDAMYSWPVTELGGQARLGQEAVSYLEDPARLPNGERQFKRKCSICHILTASSARRAGPTLAGLFGRRAGTVPDYAYSDTLAGSEIIWNETTIDGLFDLGPDHYIPGTKMPMQRITAASDRKDLIDYLRTETMGERQ